MNHDNYVMLAFTFVLLYLPSTILHLMDNTATGNTVQTSVDETEQITESVQRQTSDRKPFFDKCELLIQYLEAFNKAITEKPDKRKSGLGKTFEMKFPHNDGSNEANNLFYAMLKVEFEKESAIVTGKPDTIAALQKISLGRNLLTLGLTKDYMQNDQATSIVETTLHVNWASVVGGYLENKQREYLSQLEQARAEVKQIFKYSSLHDPTQEQTGRASPPKNPVEVPVKSQMSDERKQYKYTLSKARSDAVTLAAIQKLKPRLTEEGTKIIQHMKSIRELLSKAEKFFEKLAASPEKKSLKLSHKLGIGKSDGAQYSQMGKFEGVFNPSAKLEIPTLLSSLEAVFGPVRADKEM
ncbi:hypothetical protein DdX_18103 [Ditylenchus destructor]|uniref:Uncharacterized protein n=1 Tax=Ditylenchus destructor TaxID=166010 RepID=A0AAD4QV71_9BILA|nr:hypothetical protein DdX_18103 [Ditylenchus destructor]